MLKKAALILPVLVLLLVVPFSASAATTYHVPFDLSGFDIIKSQANADEPAMWSGATFSENGGGVRAFLPSGSTYCIQFTFPSIAKEPQIDIPVVSGDTISISGGVYVHLGFDLSAIEVIYSPYGYQGVGSPLASARVSSSYVAGTDVKLSFPSATCTQSGNIGEVVIRFYLKTPSSGSGKVVWIRSSIFDGFDLSIGSGQLAEEKDEAGKRGNSATDSITDVIPGDTASFSSALQSFASSMSYAGTDAKWTFPAMKIPSIDGVMDEITLNSEQEIDISYWVSIIPSDILEVVQILCTIALIFFCVKELYGTISYFMVLKGGGSSE